eukprot:scaffold174534_cov14-Tisochrysis_lutea.AAC.1
MVAKLAVDRSPELRSDPRPVISAMQSVISSPDSRIRAAVSGSSLSTFTPWHKSVQHPVRSTKADIATSGSGHLPQAALAPPSQHHTP